MTQEEREDERMKKDEEGFMGALETQPKPGTPPPPGARPRPRARRRVQHDVGPAIAPLYTPLDAPEFERIGFPGAYPFTRGAHASGYRGKLWTMRMFAGFGTAEETNARFKYLLGQGQTGLSVAFDMPTLYGYDTDAPEAEGEFGLCGVACRVAPGHGSAAGRPAAGRDVTTSMTINSPAAIIWAMYIAAAEKRGIGRHKLGGTLQNDILKEYIAQKEFIFPPRPSMRLVTDTVEFAARQMPLWNPISVSGYHIREAGSTAAQELAFTLADGFEYVRWALARGLEIDDFAPRISFFFNAHNDFFEEIAKYRAARRIWAQELRETFGAQQPALVAHALSHPDRRREPHRPTAPEQRGPRRPAGPGRRVGRHAEPPHQLDGRGPGAAQRRRRHRRPAHPADHRPRERRDQHGGPAGRLLLRRGAHRRDGTPGLRLLPPPGRVRRHVGGASRRAFPSARLPRRPCAIQREVEAGRRIIVGVNDYASGERQPVPILHMDVAGYRRQMERLADVRRSRDNRAVRGRLAELAQAARQENRNLMEPILDAVRNTPPCRR